jgi:predicted GNAT family acetyltransferase
MQVNSFLAAEDFLAETREVLEANEAANSLMLGVCERLVRQREGIGAAPCLKTVVDGTEIVLAVMMTPPHKLVVYHHQRDVQGATVVLIEDMIAGGWHVPGVLGPGLVAQVFAREWTQKFEQDYTLERGERVYRLDKVIIPAPKQGRLRLAVEEDIDLVSRWRYEFNQDIFGDADLDEAYQSAVYNISRGDVFLWEDGMVVSTAMKTRPTRRGISVTFVYTPPELRRQGYATACVGELSRLLLASGWEFCALFADLANPTSNSIYQKIGYQPVCDFEGYIFSDSE